LAICQQYSGIYHKVRCDDEYIATDKQEEFEDTKDEIRTVNRRRTDNTIAKRKSAKQNIASENKILQSEKHGKWTTLGKMF